VLNSDTYRTTRDIILKAALDEPRVVPIEISRLEVPTRSALSVFTTAQRQTNRWPDIPMAMVCNLFGGRNTLECNGSLAG
jgi:hypothetical protein